MFEPAVIVALGLIGVVFGVGLILPVLAYFRARTTDARVRDLVRRLEALEHRLGAQGSAAPAAERVGRIPDPVLPVPDPALGIADPAPRITTPAARLPEPDTRIPDESTLEQTIGGRWLLYAGIAAVILGVTYFVKFAFDNGWISEPLRVAAGGAIGTVLILAGMHFWSRGLGLFGQALAGGGIVVFYVSIYAALHFYRLIAEAPAFVLMTAATAGAAWLADRQRSQPLAALAMTGGFATPLLVGGERGVQVVLFTYIAILIAGAAVLARRHAWPLLAAGSYGCTFVLVLIWFFTAYRAEAWLRTELFLTLYAGLFGYMLLTLTRSGNRSPQAQLAMAALVTAPFVYHLASLNLLNRHPAAWLVYLVLATASGLVIAQRARATWIRLIVLFIVGIPALVWLSDLRFPGWYAPALVTALVLYGMHLAAQWEAAGERQELRTVEIAHAQLNGLLLPLSLYLFFDNRAAAWNPWIMAALAAWNAGLAFLARGSAAGMRIQFIALAATLSAITIVLAFDGPVIPVGWAAEGVFLAWLATRERSRAIGLGAAMLIALGCLRLFDQFTLPLAVSESPFVNARALAALVIMSLLAWLAWRLADDSNDGVRGGARNGVVIAANVLAIAWLTVEIRGWLTDRSQVAISVTWALYAVGLIALGIRRRYAPARYLAIGLLAMTVIKVLAFDIAGLDRFYRMLSVLGVGLLLLVASYLYQRRAADEA